MQLDHLRSSAGTGEFWKLKIKHHWPSADFSKCVNAAAMLDCGLPLSRHLQFLLFTENTQIKNIQCGTCWYHGNRNGTAYVYWLACLAIDRITCRNGPECMTPDTTSVPCVSVQLWTYISSECPPWARLFFIITALRGSQCAAFSSNLFLSFGRFWSHPRERSLHTQFLQYRCRNHIIGIGSSVLRK
jgi:hypothetical protein